MKTQLVLCIGGSLLAGMSACKDKAPEKEVPMNVIYILADDMGISVVMVSRKSRHRISTRWRGKECCLPSIMPAVRLVPLPVVH